MRGRQFVWSDPKVRKLAARFVPAADEVWRLHNRKGPDCDFFRLFCEEGHYGGRMRPTSTRQGIYCAAPSGKFLASINTTDPRAMARMLERALEQWRALPKGERYLKESPVPGAARAFRGERSYPKNGLVLRVFSRDLPRKGRKLDGWRGRAWNQDFAWFRGDEARTFLPEKCEVGAVHDVPAALVRRLARCHFIDNVCGQTLPYTNDQVQRARLVTTVEGVSGPRVEVRLSGETRTEAKGRWRMGGLRAVPKEMTRGFETRLQGRAVFDLEQNRFVAFELVAAGPRWGGTQYNARDDDLGPAPMGIALVLAGDSPAERVAPSALHHYGW